MLSIDSGINHSSIFLLTCPVLISLSKLNSELTDEEMCFEAAVFRREVLTLYLLVGVSWVELLRFPLGVKEWSSRIIPDLKGEISLLLSLLTLY
jgi:hypothetical protein